MIPGVFVVRQRFGQPDSPFSQAPSSASQLLLEMGRTKCSEEEMIHNLNRRATEAKINAQRKKIEVVMKLRPSTVEPLFEKLKSMGFDESWLSQRESGPRSFQAQAAESRRKRLATGEVKGEFQEELCDDEDNDNDEDTAAGAMPHDPIPKPTTLGNLTYAALRDKVLSRLGASNLSAASIKACK